MNKLLFAPALLVLIFIGCQEKKDAGDTSSAKVYNKTEKSNHLQHSSEFINRFTEKVQNLISDKRHTSFDELQSQKLERIEENSDVLVSTIAGEKMNGNQIYNHLKERTVVIGSSYYCNQCPNLHLNNASGFVIHEDGVIVTNYHVIEVKEGFKVSGVFVSDNQGNVYPVTSILAASQSNDLAILKVDTGGKKLKPIALAHEEILGDNVYMMGHPFSHTYFMTKGIVAQKYVSEYDDETKIAITAEFGQGASGGPIVNDYGQIIGMVSGTHLKYTNGSSKHGALQMLIKEAIPVSVINNYIVSE